MDKSSQELETFVRVELEWARTQTHEQSSEQRQRRKCEHWRQENSACAVLNARAQRLAKSFAECEQWGEWHVAYGGRNIGVRLVEHPRRDVACAQNTHILYSYITHTMDSDLVCIVLV